MRLFGINLEHIPSHRRAVPSSSSAPTRNPSNTTTDRPKREPGWTYTERDRNGHLQLVRGSSRRRGRGAAIGTGRGHGRVAEQNADIADVSRFSEHNIAINRARDTFLASQHPDLYLLEPSVGFVMPIRHPERMSAVGIDFDLNVEVNTESRGRPPPPVHPPTAVCFENPSYNSNDSRRDCFRSCNACSHPVHYGSTATVPQHQSCHMDTGNADSTRHHRCCPSMYPDATLSPPSCDCEDAGDGECTSPDSIAATYASSNPGVSIADDENFSDNFVLASYLRDLRL